MLRGIAGGVVLAVVAMAGCSSTVEDGAIVTVESGAALAPSSPRIAVEEARLVPSSEGGNFGHSIALRDDTAVVGAIGGAGSAYVFRRTGHGWKEQARLVAEDGAAADFFGDSVAIYGNTILVGAPYDDDNGDLSGSAHVFVWNGSAWTQQAKLLPSDGAAYQRFGEAVAISGDTAVVGTVTAGAYVFRRRSGVWEEQSRLVPSGGLDPEDLVGQAVAMWGKSVLVGAILDDDRGLDAGAIHAFSRSTAGKADQGTLLASDGTAGDWFGGSVAMVGNTAIVGASGDDDRGPLAGSAYVFEWRDAGWQQAAKLLPGDVSAGDRFGFSVALGADTLVVGSVADDAQGPFSGSAHVFERSDGAWSELPRILAADGAQADLFGHAVAVWGDTVLIGAPGDDDEGSVTVFALRELDRDDH
jgi:hypothetical protein